MVRIVAFKNGPPTCRTSEFSERFSVLVERVLKGSHSQNEEKDSPIVYD